MPTSVFSLTWLSKRGIFVQILRLGPRPALEEQVFAGHGA